MQVVGRGDAELARVAELQRGVIHRRQLAAAGLGRGSIDHRRSTGRLHRLHSDVFLTGRPRLERLGAETAAVLQFAGHAVLSHDSAALLWGIDPQTDGYEPTITLIGRDAHRRPGLKIHRVGRLHPDDMACRHGLPTTSAARMLIDRAGCVEELELENDLAELRRRHTRHVTEARLRAALARVAPNHKGIAELRRLLDGPAAPALTRSHYERRLIALLREANLPVPAANATVCGHMVDLVWQRERLIVEFDGYRFHRDRRAFETDRDRDAALVAAGYRVIRVTARGLDERPLVVVARIAAALAAVL